ncbi:MAG TPA: imidazole glycerol phosphate synthase subunit HisH [Alphaproteobacteria bacterium]|nr:imidazole glycerol phosphate synthase subunit HisH [Alphaproteobacteria bacterium]
MTVVVIDYGSGNLRSAAKAVERAAASLASPPEVAVVADARAVLTAERIVLPGQGAFGDCAAGVRRVPGLREALEEAIIHKGRPFLGICVGMQLMASRGLEHGSHDGFGWISGEVVRLEPGEARLKIPQMGWNDLIVDQPDHPVLAGVPTGTDFYFVHGYAMRCRDPAHILAHVEYGQPLPAVIGRDNLVGTQFHPDKSQAAGLRLIANFLAWRP